MSLKIGKIELKQKFISLGENKFYVFLLSNAINQLVVLEKQELCLYTPNIQYLIYHDYFMTLYRKEGEEIYIELAKIFRRAAHKIYRVMLKKQLTNHNVKFLNLVKNGCN